MRVLPFLDGAILWILLTIHKELFDQILRIFWGVGCLARNESFIFGAGQDWDPDSGIFNGIIATAGKKQLHIGRGL